MTNRTRNRPNHTITRRQLGACVALAGYLTVLVAVLVLKVVPTIHVGSVRFKLGGRTARPGTNLRPLHTIAASLHGDHGSLVAAVNVIGNIAILVPVGLLATLIWHHRSVTRSLLLGAAVAVSIEGLQGILHLGIVDIDDVLLNTLGVLLGHGCVAAMRGTANPTLHRATPAAASQQHW